MKIAVTVEVELNAPMPDAEARTHARWMLERHGLTVTRTSIVKDKDAGKAFMPAAGKPGSILVREGRKFQVWADHPFKGCVWAIPVDPTEGDAPIYRVGDRADACHADGTMCAPSLSYRDDTGTPHPEPVKVPCIHKSHHREEAAA